VRTAGVCPEAGPGFLSFCAPVDEHFSRGIENENRECAVQYCRVHMAGHLFPVALYFVLPVNQNEQILHQHIIWTTALYF
jgi:hypothetical protein